MDEATTTEREARGDAGTGRLGDYVEATEATPYGTGGGMDRLMVPYDEGDGVESASSPVVPASPEAAGPLRRPVPSVPLFDRREIDRALKEYDVDDDDFLGPDEERPPARDRGNEHAAWVGTLRRARSMDPRRPELVGTMAMVEALDAATATSPHFSEVTSVVRQAVEFSAITGLALRLPPILAVSEPGVGKTFYARALAGGAGHAVRGHGHERDERPRDPRGLLDLVEGRPRRTAGEVAPIRLRERLAPLLPGRGGQGQQPLRRGRVPGAALGPGTRERLALRRRVPHVPRRARPGQLDPHGQRRTAIPEPVLQRMLPVAVRRPTRDESRVIVASVAATVMRERAGGLLDAPADDGLDALAHVPARKAKQALERAVADAICSRSGRVEADRVVRALALVERRTSAYGFVG